MAERVLRYGASAADRERWRALVAEHGSPLLVVSRGALLERYRRLQAYLPGVALYYAIKAFPHAEVLRLLAEAGCGFDVASAGEIDMLQKLGISGRRAIHTHPVKKDRDIRAALRGGATTFVVDHAEELKKLRPYRERVGVLLRLGFRAGSAVVDLSRKFGCAPDQVEGIVQQAVDMGIHIRGLCFHVGSQALSPETHVQAIEHSAALIADLNSRLHAPMNVLDIGGGFPVDYSGEGEADGQWFGPLQQALAALPADLRVFAEPGRYLVAPAVTAISSVTGCARRGDYQWVYLDDGIYGSYSGQLFDHVRYPLQILRDDGPRQPAILAGPTCDSIDIIAEDIALPAMREGDLVIGHMMGAYTFATATRFNSLDAAKVVFVD